ncbi:exo-alpha-sialidase [Pseudobacteriovorax antillogorgiicola]|uniref:exo-alpha-sialidase n=1 Tax=Pseudobacteriovorax antillogorgiicola TaxID=1513793 RepID=UPI001A9F9A1E|nr:exo-alpha-sialidase [Pseudobacteriovorax antillogorgiicola]
MESHFIHSPEEEHPYCHCPSLLKGRRGELHMVFYAYKEAETKQAILCYAETRDQKWQSSKVLIKAQSASLGNPILFESPQNTFHIIYSSIDNGYWDQAFLNYTSFKVHHPLRQPQRLRLPQGFLVRHPPLYLRGRWLLPLYDERTMTSFLAEARESFTDWKICYEFPDPGIIQGQLVPAADGELLIFFRPIRDNDTIHFARSRDSGDSWSGLIDTGLPCPQAGISAAAQGHEISLIYNHTKEHQRFPLSLNQSMDQGKTWQEPWHFDKIRFELSYPQFFFEGSDLQGVYTYNRRMIKHVAFNPKESEISEVSMQRQGIARFKQIHQGKSLFIIASGPSIQDLDLSRLDRRMTMGLNRSFLKYPNSYYHCMFDQRLFDQYQDQLQDHRCLFTLEGRPWGVQMENRGAEGFSDDLSQGIYTGYTISYFALQLAIYMGFNQIFFLGLDLQNTSQKTHFFGFDYHSANHNNTEFPKMITSFEKAAQYLKDKPVKVYNCSLQSQLHVFEKISFDEAMRIS